MVEPRIRVAAPGIHSEPYDNILPKTVAKRVVSGERFLLKIKKSKGSCAWDQFCLV